ncbi:MAG TPA: hypothetical protein VMF90_08440 [Rhizobiaceae bacterium]|nr:hypothetical protein [Rhizobiaceae bacterium]
MASFSDLTDIDLEKRVRDLTREVQQLRRAAAKRGAGFVDDTGETLQDIYAAVADQVSSSLPRLRKGAKAIEKSAYDHPATVAAVGLLVVGLAATLFLRRR